MVLKRHGAYRQLGPATTRISYPCKDGYVSFFYPGGTVGARSMAGMAQWMEEDGMGDPYMQETRWEEFEFGTLDQETLDRVMEPVLRFFATKTKRELSEGAIRHRVILFPVSDARTCWSTHSSRPASSIRMWPMGRMWPVGSSAAR